MPAREISDHLLPQGAYRPLAKQCDRWRALEKVEHPRGRSIGALHLLDLEFLRPRDDRSPEELIKQDDDCNHGRNAPGNGACIALIGGGLEVGTEPGQAEGTGTENKLVAGHTEKT